MQPTEPQPIRLTTADKIRALQSPKFRKTLQPELLAALPANPAGVLTFKAAQTDIVKASDRTTQLGCVTYDASCNTYNAMCTSYNSGCNSYNFNCNTNNHYCRGPMPQN